MAVLDHHPAVTTELRAAGCVFAEDEAALMLAEADDHRELRRMVALRVTGTPLEQIVGWASFDRLRVRLAPGVFVPRRRTELLARLATGWAHERSGSVVVDLCCGSGALAAAVRDRVADAEVHAADLDPAAVACARTNLPHDSVHHGDLYAALPERLRGRVDVLVVNAPYVPTASIPAMPPEARDHEHHLALDGGDDGLDVHRRVAAGAPGWLRVDGRIAIETSREQADRTRDLLADAGLVTEVVVDHDRDAVAVTGRAP